MATFAPARNADWVTYDVVIGDGSFPVDTYRGIAAASAANAQTQAVNIARRVWAEKFPAADTTRFRAVSVRKVA